MTVSVSNTSNTHTVQAWRLRTNEIADAMSVKVVTVESNAAVGNATVTGTFQANVLLASNVGSISGNLTITTNVTATAKVNLGAGANVMITAGNATHRVLVVNSSNSFSLLAVKLTMADHSDANVSAPANNDVFAYRSSESAWKNVALATLLTQASVNAAFLEGHDTTYFANATHVHAFSTLTSIPTTVSGYGMVQLLLGNSTINTMSTNTTISSSNTLGEFTVTAAGMSIGNTTSNSTVNVTTTARTNASGNTQLTAGNVHVQNTTSDAYVDPGTLRIGNSTINATMNSTSFKVMNSTSNAIMNIPTVAQANGSYYLNANGGWQGPLARLDLGGQQVDGGGFRITSFDIGVVNSGTLTLDPGDRPMQHYTANGAHTLAPGSNIGSFLLDIINGSSAGTITTSGWTKVSGDTFTTTNAHKFRCSCSIGQQGSLLVIQAMQ